MENLPPQVILSSSSMPMSSAVEMLELVVAVASLSAFMVPILFLCFFLEYSDQSENSLPSRSSMVWMLPRSALSSSLTSKSSFFFERSSLGPFTSNEAETLELVMLSALLSAFMSWMLL